MYNICFISFRSVKFLWHQCVDINPSVAGFFACLAVIIFASCYNNRNTDNRLFQWEENLSLGWSYWVTVGGSVSLWLCGICYFVESRLLADRLRNSLITKIIYWRSMYEVLGLEKPVSSFLLALNQELKCRSRVVDSLSINCNIHRIAWEKQYKMGCYFGPIWSRLKNSNGYLKRVRCRSFQIVYALKLYSCNCTDNSRKAAEQLAGFSISTYTTYTSGMFIWFCTANCSA